MHFIGRETNLVKRSQTPINSTTSLSTNSPQSNYSKYDKITHLLVAFPFEPNKLNKAFPILGDNYTYGFCHPTFRFKPIVSLCYDSLSYRKINKLSIVPSVLLTSLNYIKLPYLFLPNSIIHCHYR